MATQRTQAVSRTTEWSAKKRYKVNDSENYNGNVYQNVTGFNSEPGVGNDWILLSQVGIKDIFAGTNVTIDKTDPTKPIINATGGGGGGVDTFVLSFPRLAISGNATNVFFASFINTSSVIFNSSTAISDHTLLTSINFSSTRLFIIPEDCIIDKITCNSNVNFELSIWKADSLSSPTTGKTEVFYQTSVGLGIANYNVASPTLSQGNILVPMIKALGGTSTYYGDLFITFKTI